MASPKKRCKDCPPETKRPAPHPGPRCATHHRIQRKARNMAAHQRRVEVTYGLDDYWSLYASQGGQCAICQRARGLSRRLAVDHNHQTGQVRGLLCGPCNVYVGRMRDCPEAFDRGAAYLRAERLLSDE